MGWPRWRRDREEEQWKRCLGWRSHYGTSEKPGRVKFIANQKEKKKEVEEEVLTLVFFSHLKILEQEFNLSLNSRHVPQFTVWTKLSFLILRMIPRPLFLLYKYYITDQYPSTTKLLSSGWVVLFFFNLRGSSILFLPAPLLSNARLALYYQVFFLHKLLNNFRSLYRSLQANTGQIYLENFPKKIFQRANIETTINTIELKVF